MFIDPILERNWQRLTDHENLAYQLRAFYIRTGKSTNAVKTLVPE